MSDNMFIEYFAELEGCNTIKNECGFITYKVKGKECYIAHMYTCRRSRGRGEGKKLFSALCDVLKQCDVEEVTCNIFKKDNGAQRNKEIYRSQGFQVFNETDHVITMTKDL